MGAFAYLGSQRFRDDTPKADRDFTLASNRREMAAVAAFAAVASVGPRGASFDESRRRRGRDADVPSMNRGGAAAATRMFRR